MNQIKVKEMNITKEEFDLLSFALSSVAIRGDQAMVMVSLVNKINDAVKTDETVAQE